MHLKMFEFEFIFLIMSKTYFNKPKINSHIIKKKKKNSI